MNLGIFYTAPDGYIGRIQTMSLDAELNIVHADASETENAPQWRIVMTKGDADIEVGAGWNRTGQRAGHYIALQIDDPALPRPLRANLVRSAHSDAFYLLWSRPAPRTPK
jgi:uncharacterized protein (DUF736 family)